MKIVFLKITICMFEEKGVPQGFKSEWGRVVEG
jgi:hypothetical protein